MEHIKIDTFEHYAIITLNRPEKRNALSRQMRQRLIDFFQDEAINIPIVIITGKGKGFCAGMDLNEKPVAEDVQHFWQVLISIYNSNSICIAAVNGSARGGGMMLINTCDLAIASDKSNVGIPKVILKSSFTDMENDDQDALMDRVASWLPLRGKVLFPSEAKDFGIVNEIIAHDMLLEKTKAFAEQLDLEKLQEKKKALNQKPFDNSFRPKAVL